MKYNYINNNIYTYIYDLVYIQMICVYIYIYIFIQYIHTHMDPLEVSLMETMDPIESPLETELMDAIDFMHVSVFMQPRDCRNHWNL